MVTEVGDTVKLYPRAMLLTYLFLNVRNMS